MIFIDLEKSKSIYDLLGVTPDLNIRKLRKAFNKYVGPLSSKSNRGDKDAEKRLMELNAEKDRFWNKEAREVYDKEIAETTLGIQQGDPVPAHVHDRAALLRSIRQRCERQ